jgi:hypothetical protein
MPALRNIFACLVHESPDCTVDLVRNLRALDPDSLVLLYNGGHDPDLLGDPGPLKRLGAALHPTPRPLAWGHLHPFALDCMRWARENYAFDTLTIVDSDQLAIRAGYSRYLTARLDVTSGIGVLGNSAEIQRRGTPIGPAEAALGEVDLWRPLLRSFKDGEQKFVHWCFWPSTVFTADASRDLSDLFGSNTQLQDIMRQTRIWATEEVILPTLAALLGYRIGVNPCSPDYVQYRSAFTAREIEPAFERPDAFWVHPVARRYDDPLRARIRERFNHYRPHQAGRPASAASSQPSVDRPLLLTIPVLEQIRGIEGWLDDAEADLLLAAASRAIAGTQSGAIVEIGSYCGKSTVVLGAALNASDDPNGRKIYAVDPHDGVVGALDQGMQQLPPTREKFTWNIDRAGIAHVVEPIVQRSFEVKWDEAVCFLFVDGLHDYFNVARDFHHFERWLAPAALVAFHDYADYYPGVETFVDELLASGGYEKVQQAGSLIVLRVAGQRPATMSSLSLGIGDSEDTALQHATTTRPAGSRMPLVTCIMPTANRRDFVAQSIRYFQRQDYSNRELIILDDGDQELTGVVPDDARIRYLRMDHKATIGAKHNLACELAAGEVIVHWDDDDWMADWRLSYQVDSILREPVATLVGLPRLYFYDPAAARAWEYIYPDGEPPWVAGGTFCYRRAFWQSHRFPDMNEGADTVFVWGLRDAAIRTHDRRDFYVALIHPANTSPKRTQDPAWHGVPIQTIHGLIAEDRSFYDGLTCV